MNIEDYRTPGQLLDSLLQERGWTQKVLAVILGVEVTIINRLIADKRPVTAEMAILFYEVFGVPPEMFLELQKRYDLLKAQITLKPDPGRATRASLFGDLPIAEMIKRGWLDAKDVRNVPEVEAALMKFFGVDSVHEIEILKHAAKKTNTFTEATPSQIAWIYRVKKIAEDMIVGRYTDSAMHNAISRLSGLLSSPVEARKVPRIMAECGIRFVIVESLASAKIDGVCFWLDDKSPVIGMSLRYDRIDNFWFVIRHEIEHVKRGHGRNSIVMLDVELEGERAGTGDNIAEEERVANEAAAEFCVPQHILERFIARKYPFFRDVDILGFANTLKIHPGLVAGQLQHRTERYDRFRQHLVKIRSSVTPNAIVDGWGDIAPVGI